MKKEPLFTLKLILTSAVFHCLPLQKHKYMFSKGWVLVIISHSFPTFKIPSRKL